jgi:hypothetical protein
MQQGLMQCQQGRLKGRPLGLGPAINSVSCQRLGPVIVVHVDSCISTHSLKELLWVTWWQPWQQGKPSRCGG